MRTRKRTLTKKRLHVYLRKLVRFFGYSQVLFLYFPQSVSKFCFDKTMTDMRRKSLKGYSVQVMLWPKYIDEIRFGCYYCKKQQEYQKPLLQQTLNSCTILIYLLCIGSLDQHFYLGCLHSILNYS